MWFRMHTIAGMTSEGLWMLCPVWVRRVSRISPRVGESASNQLLGKNKDVEESEAG